MSSSIFERIRDGLDEDAKIVYFNDKITAF